MFEHLLVPLDGSWLAEAALPAASYLAEVLGAWVTLVHVVEQDAPQQIHSDRHLVDPDEAEVYLEEVAGRAFPPGVRVEWHVHTAPQRDVARSIVAHVDELAPDLIVMCTHGQGGLQTWLFGSIAQQVIALGATPVLLIRPSDVDALPPFTCQKLLVPLDGNPEHEQGLAVAAGLVEPCKARMHLLRVVPTLGTLDSRQAASARLLPGTTSALLDLDQASAETQLQHLVEELEGQGLWATTDVRRGDPATVIAQVAQEEGASLVVLGTHGKTGLEAFWSESVAPQVCNRTRLPLLLVPVRGQVAKA
jgi:nucleotide-binding universal stress UspA family protein